MTFYVNQGTNHLFAKVKYSTGAVKTIDLGVLA
jgi:hypothetical protein